MFEDLYREWYERKVMSECIMLWKVCWNTLAYHACYFLYIIKPNHSQKTNSTWVTTLSIWGLHTDWFSSSKASVISSRNVLSGWCRRGRGIIIRRVRWSLQWSLTTEFLSLLQNYRITTSHLPNEPFEFTEWILLNSTLRGRGMLRPIPTPLPPPSSRAAAVPETQLFLTSLAPCEVLFL